MTSTAVEQPTVGALPEGLVMAEQDVTDLEALYFKSGMLEALMGHAALLIQSKSEDRKAREMLAEQYRQLSGVFPAMFRDEMAEMVREATTELSEDATFEEIMVAAGTLDRALNLIDGRVGFMFKRTGEALAQAAAGGMPMPMPMPMMGAAGPQRGVRTGFQAVPSAPAPGTGLYM